jgi:hypothetical protein
MQVQRQCRGFEDVLEAVLVPVSAFVPQVMMSKHLAFEVSRFS